MLTARDAASPRTHAWKVAIVLLHCNIDMGQPSLFCATRRTGYNRLGHPISVPYVATGLPRPRSRSRALHRRRAEARRGVVRAARAAADADPPPGAGGAAGEPQAARRLRDHGPRRRERRRGRRRSPSIARSISCATTASCIGSRAATPSSPASTITRTGDLVVFLICEHCGAVGEAPSAAVADQLKAAARAAGFTPKAPVIEIGGVCAHCRQHDHA